MVAGCDAVADAVLEGMIAVFVLVISVNEIFHISDRACDTTSTYGA